MVKSPEEKLVTAGIELPPAVTPLGPYVEALQTGNLLFLSGMHIADAASDLLRDVFGENKLSVRLVFGMQSLPLGVPVELEVIFEVC
jgi:enamine deaminase RidA (YjgF/YER057c/UK114 family)